jgi:hypothetical protein
MRFIKIRPVEIEFFQCGRTDMMQLVGAFHNVATRLTIVVYVYTLYIHTYIILHRLNFMEFLAFLEFIFDRNKLQGSLTQNCTLPGYYS